MTQFQKKKFSVFMGCDTKQARENYDKVFGKKRLIPRKLRVRIITYTIMVLYVLFCALIITWGRR